VHRGIEEGVEEGRRGKGGRGSLHSPLGGIEEGIEEGKRCVEGRGRIYGAWRDGGRG